MEIMETTSATFDSVFSNSSHHGVDGEEEISMDNLYPALVQCFAIIICGYLAGRMNIISNTEAKGLNTFVGTFALPSLIFLSLSELDWKTVNWTFLLAILIAKSIVFVSVGIISLLVARPLNLGRAALLAIFCTQSNDFAIGYPIVLALYKTIHPEYASYIYLMAPISLAVLNPIGFVLLEIQKIRNKCAEEHEAISGINISPSHGVCPEIEAAQSASAQQNRFLKGKVLVVVKTIESIFFNPVLLMTVLGVIGGVVFPSGLPVYLSGVLNVLGKSFTATALFLLGLRMVGKAHTLQGSGFLLPGVLILVKLLVFPLITRQTVNIMNAGSNFSDTTDLSTFGFLYGTFPAAPGVFVIASQYNIDVDLIANSMVVCTFISAPLMFISAKMITITTLDPSDYLVEMQHFAFDIGVAAIVGSVWLFVLFIVSKKITRMPHRITSCLVLSQLLGSIGVMLWAVMGATSGWRMYLQFGLVTLGTYSSRLWTSFLAITLLFLQCRSLCFVLKLFPAFVFIGWGFPLLLIAALLIFDYENITPSDKRNPSFQYGNAQAAIAVFILVMCFFVTVGSLVLHQRHKKQFEKFLSLSKEVSSPESDMMTSTADLIQQNRSEVNFTINASGARQRAASSSDDDMLQNEGCAGNSSGHGNSCCTRSSTVTTVVDIEDLVSNRGSINADEGAHTPVDAGATCSSQFNCDSESRQVCQSLVERYRDQNRGELEPIELSDSMYNHQTLKHIVLLIFLLCSMFVGLALSVWTLVMDGMSGIYVELAFLDAFLNFGQSLIVLGVFVTDTGELFLPLLKYWRRLWYGANVVQLPKWDALSADTKHTCDQFTTHHLDNCRKAIAKDKRWRIKVYKKVFYGNDFIDWLIEVGLAHDRTEATIYARHLIDGRVLRHINNVYHFYDKNLLYTFCGRL